MNQPTLFDGPPPADKGPRDHAESSFAYLKRSGRPEAANIRTALETWLGSYPCEHKAELCGRLGSDDDVAHQAATFELALHEAFLRLALQPTIHPTLSNTTTTPDFLLRPDGQRPFAVEAVSVAFSSQEERNKGRVLGHIYDEINKLDSPIYLAVDVDGGTTSQPPGRAIRSFLRSKLQTVDLDELSTLGRTLGPSAMPTWIYNHEGLTIEFTPMPVNRSSSDEKRGPVIGMHSGSGVWVDSKIPALLKALRSKARKYGSLGRAFLIAVNSLSPYLSATEGAKALFGSENKVRARVTVPPGSPVPLWSGRNGPIHRNVSGVLFVETLIPWTLGVCRTTLFTNPWASYPLASAELRRLPTATVGEDGELSLQEGEELASVLGLWQGWPRQARGEA